MWGALFFKWIFFVNFTVAFQQVEPTTRIHCTSTEHSGFGIVKKYITKIESVMSNYSNNRPATPRGARLAFGILMVFIYVGVGLLFILQILPFFNSAVLGYILGGLLCAYGVFRAYLLYRGR